MVDFWSSPRPCGRCRTWWGADGKVSLEKLCISLPYVEKPFNSKVIKSFVPELRSGKCFCVSGFRCYLYMFLNNYEHFMILRICILWVCYTITGNHKFLTHLKMKLPKYYSLINHIYIHFNVCKQKTDVKLLLLHRNT